MIEAKFFYNADGQVIAHPYKQGEIVAVERFLWDVDGKLVKVLLEDRKGVLPRAKPKTYDISKAPTELRERFFAKAKGV